jgi:sugar lactone lactonase YvrE
MCFRYAASGKSHAFRILREGGRLGGPFFVRRACPQSMIKHINLFAGMTLVVFGALAVHAPFGLACGPVDLLIEAVAGSRPRGNLSADYNGEGRALWSVLGLPRGMAVDSAGNLFIGDIGRVRRVTPAGIITTVAGDGVSDYGGDGGPAAEAQLRYAADVAVDSENNLYIADIDDHRIRKVTPDGMISTVAGTGTGGFDGDGGPAANAKLDEPAGVVVDTGGNIYIADSRNHRIRKVTLSGQITTVAGSGARDTFDFKGFPIYGGGYGGDGGPALQALLKNPRGVAIDMAGNLFIADSGNQRIRRVNIAGTIDTIAGNGAQDFSGDDGPASSAALAMPESITVDETGNLYIADTGNHRIRKVGIDGNIATIAGVGSPGFNGNGQPATASQLNFPGGIEVDADGNLLVADTGNYQVRRLFLGDPSQPPPEPPTTWILPSSARSIGLNGAFFTTELVLANTSSQDALLTLEFLNNNRDGRDGIQKALTLGAGRSVVYADVLGTLFGVTDGYGAIRITCSSATLAIQGQTSTRSPNKGSYGQSVLAIQHQGWIVQGLPRTIVGIREDNQFRTNLIMANATEAPLDVNIQLRSPEGASLASRQLLLRPLEMSQLTQLVRYLGVTEDTAGAQLLISTSTPGGYLAAYAALIDNVTNDPRTLLPQTGEGVFPYGWILPSSAHSPGLDGAYYTTDLTLANISNGDVTYSLKFLGNQVDGRSGPEKTFVIAPRTSVTFPDVLRSLFGVSEDFGAIQVALSALTSTTPHSLAVQAETSTSRSGGTFGQSVPAVAEGEFIDVLTPRSIIGVREGYWLPYQLDSRQCQGDANGG